MADMQIILTIAGSDPSGGAGIQADIKTITSVGCYSAAVITAITCQNSLGVSRISPLDPSLVHDQIISVLEDLAVTHIKIGMTGNSAIVHAIQDALSTFSGEIILDPVLKSSSGTSLLNQSALSLSPLIDRATILTPNTSELCVLTGLPCSTTDETRKAGRKLLRHYPRLRGICLKGGHLQEDLDTITDTLLFTDGTTIRTKAIKHQRHQTKNSHGTGCTFAAAFAAFHATYHNDLEAFEKTVNYVDSLLTWGKGDKLGEGTGGLAHFRFKA